MEKGGFWARKVAREDLSFSYRLKPTQTSYAYTFISIRAAQLDPQNTTSEKAAYENPVELIKIHKNHKDNADSMIIKSAKLSE